jgi:hypothetical protein
MIRRGETARLRKVIKAKSIDDIAKVAKPWEPITDEYLSTKELLLLMGIDPRVKYHQYRRYLHFCTIAAHPGGNPDSLPHDLRTCFADETIKIQAFRGRNDSTRAKIEYRVAIADLRKDHQLKALDIVIERINKCLKLSERARLALQTLTHQNKEQAIGSLAENAAAEET